MLIEEKDIEFSHFLCCGDEDLYPFACPACRRLMVFCYECDTLYSNLHDLSGKSRDFVNSFKPQEPIFSCAGCGYNFEYQFMKNGLYKADRELWVSSGLGHLLRKGTNA